MASSRTPSKVTYFGTPPVPSEETLIGSPEPGSELTLIPSAVAPVDTFGCGLCGPPTSDVTNIMWDGGDGITWDDGDNLDWDE